MTKIDLFTEWVFNWLQAREPAPKSVHTGKSLSSNRGLAEAAHSPAIDRNHEQIVLPSPAIYTEAQKSTAQLTH